MSIMPGEKPESRVLHHFVGLVLFPLIGLGVSIIWLIFVTQVLGIGKEGFGVAGVIIAIPVYSIAFGLLIWLPLWILHDRFLGEMSGLKAALIGLAVGFVLAVFLAGLRSFGPAPGAQYFGWAILAVTGIGGWCHNYVITRKVEERV